MLLFLSGLTLGLLVAIVAALAAYHHGLRDGCNGSWYRLARSKRIVKLVMGNKGTPVDKLATVGMN